eukprot:TRINITY_DN930_c4_g1_i1.p1 TRINITY_DN930_c4_g1~~TRINITY_DN930_c4_g1_i1.p1  ORF type:complete len:616 (+),score=128.10 TRINITY_DN930_c4_g1_i1:182-2029(+)
MMARRSCGTILVLLFLLAVCCSRVKSQPSDIHQPAEFKSAYILLRIQKCGTKSLVDFLETHLTYADKHGKMGLCGSGLSYPAINCRDPSDEVRHVITKVVEKESPYCLPIMNHHCYLSSALMKALEEQRLLQFSSTLRNVAFFRDESQTVDYGEAMMSQTVNDEKHESDGTTHESMMFEDVQALEQHWEHQKERDAMELQQIDLEERAVLQRLHELRELQKQHLGRNHMQKQQEEHEKLPHVRVQRVLQAVDSRPTKTRSRQRHRNGKQEQEGVRRSSTSSAAAEAEADAEAEAAEAYPPSSSYTSVDDGTYTSPPIRVSTNDTAALESMRSLYRPFRVVPADTIVKFITTLRDPVSRVVSEYKHTCNVGGYLWEKNVGTGWQRQNHLKEDTEVGGCSSGESLMTYVRDKVNRVGMRNRMTRALAQPWICARSHTGFEYAGSSNDECLLHSAILTLEDPMTITLVLEHLYPSLVLLAHDTNFETPLKAYSKIQEENEFGDIHITLTDGMRDEISAFNSLDVRLYKHALRILREKLEAIDRSPRHKDVDFVWSKTCEMVVTEDELALSRLKEKSLEEKDVERAERDKDELVTAWYEQKNFACLDAGTRMVVNHLLS